MLTYIHICNVHDICILYMCNRYTYMCKFTFSLYRHKNMTIKVIYSSSLAALTVENNSA